MKRKYKSINKEEFSQFYEVTRDGRIFSKETNREYFPSNDVKGYKILRLPYLDSTNKDKRRPFKVHRLVAMFYLKDYSEDLQVNHKNGDKADNRVENLEMVTNRQNVLHAWNVLDSTKRRENARQREKQNKDKIQKAVEASIKANSKRIAKLNDNKEIIEIFDSLWKAAKSMKRAFSGISYAAKNGTKSAGFYWKYIC